MREETYYEDAERCCSPAPSAGIQTVMQEVTFKTMLSRRQVQQLVGYLARLIGQAGNSDF